MGQLPLESNLTTAMKQLLHTLKTKMEQTAFAFPGNCATIPCG